jgi:hypothetical protein
VQARVFLSLIGDVPEPQIMNAIRLAQGGASILITEKPPAVLLGDRDIPLPRNGLLRLLHVPSERRQARTLSAPL